MDDDPRTGFASLRTGIRINQSLDLTVLLTMINENADGSCGNCAEPVLRVWGYCPHCGFDLDWVIDLTDDTVFDIDRDTVFDLEGEEGE